MSAYPRRYDSSSSDDDSHSRQSVLREYHYDKDCRYQKFRVRLEGQDVYVWLRSCFCDEYNSYKIRKGVKNLKPEDGKNVHFSNECRWRKREKDDFWELRQKCTRSCNCPRSNSYVGNTAHPFY